MTFITGTPGVGTPPGISLTVPALVTAGMQALIIFGTADGTDWDPVPAKGGATFVLVDDRAATNHRVTVWRATGLVAGDTITLSSTVSKSCNVWHVYTDDFSLVPGSVSAAVRGASSAAVTSGSVTPALGQQVLLVATERTTATPTTVSSAASSGGETITQAYHNEQANTVSSAYVGTFTASAAASRTATITYSDASTNGYAALILCNIPAALAEDAFTGTNGDALSSTWAAGQFSTGAGAAIQSNAARFTTPSAGGYTGNCSRKVNISNPTDQVWLMKFRWPTGAECYPQVWMRATNDALDGAGGYCFELNRPASTWSIRLFPGGSNLATAAFTFASNTWYWVRCGIVDDELKLKIWADGATEPAAWTSEITDTTYAGAGRVGLRVGPGLTGSATFEIDDFRLDDTFTESGAGLAALTGSGSLSANGVPTPTATPALTGSGALTATGVPTPAGAAGLAGAGALTTARTPAIPGTVALTGAGALTATGTPAVGAGAAALAGAGTLAAAGAPGFAVTAARTGSGTLTASAGLAPADTAPSTGSGVLTATGVPEPVVTVAATGAGALTVARTPAIPGAASATGTGVLAVDVVPGLTGTVDRTGAGALTATGVPSPAGGPGLSGVGSLTVSGAPAVTAAAALAGVGALSVAAGVAASSTATLTGTGALAGSGTPKPTGTATLTGSGALLAVGTPRITGTAALSGAGALTAAGVPRPVATVALGGAGALTLTRTPAIPGTAVLAGVGALAVALSGQRGERGTARLAEPARRIRLGTDDDD